MNEDIRIGGWAWSKEEMLKGSKVINVDMHDNTKLYCYYDKEFNAFVNMYKNGNFMIYRSVDSTLPVLDYGWEIYTP